MSRFLLIDTDGETILTTLGMSEGEALLNVGAGQSLVAIDPGTDTGAVIDHGSVKYSAVDGLVLIADDTPVSAFASFDLAEI